MATISFDTLLPNVPSITAVADNVSPITGNVASGGSTNDTVLVLSGLAEANASVAVYDGQTLLGTVTADANGQWTFNTAALTDGTSYSLSVTATDAAGNISAPSPAHTVTVDTSAPAAPVINLVAGDDFINAAEQTGVITGRAEPGATVALTLGAGNVRSVVADSNGDWQYTLVAADITAMGQGPETLSATATDAAGNDSAPTNRAITVDTAPPLAPVIDPVATDNVVNAAEAGSTITGSAEPYATVELTLGAGNTRNVTADSSGAWQYPLIASDIAAMGEGGETISARAVDAAGNASLTQASRTIAIDTVEPTLTISDDAGGLAVDTFLLTFQFSEAVTGFDASDIALSAGTQGAFVAISPTHYTLVVTPPAGAIGTLSVSVAAGQAQDGAVNLNQAAQPLSLAYDTVPPTVNSVAISAAVGGQNSTLNAGDTVSVTVEMSKPTVVSGGAPSIKLDIGGTLVDAAYVSGSGSTALVFAYTVLAGQNDSNGISIVSNGLVLNGASLRDGVGRAAVISHAAATDNADYLVDTTAPTLAISSSASSLKAGETALISFGFSEDPLGSFTWDDATQSGSLVVTGGRLGAVSASGATRTATFTPTADVNAGSAGITVAAAAYTDAAGNAGGAASMATISFDTLLPNVPSITAVADNVSPITGNVASGGSTNDTVLVLSGLAEANASVAVYDGQTLLGTVTADANGQWTFNTAALTDGTSYSLSVTATDAAGNISAPSPAHTVTVDTSAPAAPVINLVAGDDFINAAEQTGVITGRAEPGATVALTLGAGNVRSVVADSNGDWQYTLVAADITAMGQGPETLSATATDAAGNVSPVASRTISTDTVAPSVTVTSDVSSLKIGQTAALTLSFSEDPGASFSASDVTVVGGLVDGLLVTSNPLVYTATFTPLPGQSAASGFVTVAAGSYGDSAANPGLVSTMTPIAIDTLAPTLAISSSQATLKAAQAAVITFNFSETPSGFDWDGSTGDIVVSGGVLGAISGSGAVRTATFTPAAGFNGDATISVAASTYTDAAGNANAAIANALIRVDALAPTLTITSDVSALRIGQTAKLTFTFSEAPGSSLDASEIVAAQGTVSNLLSTFDPLVYTATFTPAAAFTGNANITVASGAYTDAAGNDGGAGATPAIAIDTAAPTVAITRDSASPALLGGGMTATVQFNFSEAPVGFSDSDISVSGGTLGAISGSGQTFSAVFTPEAGIASGNAVIIVAGATYLDQPGNAGQLGSLAAGQIAIDTLAPTLTITSSAPSVRSGQSVTVTFSFSEAPGSSFTASAILIHASEGTVSNLSAPSGNGKVYTATFTPANGFTGTANISVAGASYQDAASNTGVATAALDIVIDAVAPTVSSVAISGAQGLQNSRLNPGDKLLVTVTMSEATTLDLANGTPTLALNIGGVSVLASYASGAGSNKLVFAYDVASSLTDLDGVSIDANSLLANGAVFTDAAGNPALDLSHSAVLSDAGYLVDTTPPGAPTIAAVTGDDLINIADAGSSTITGTAEAGATVSLRIGANTRNVTADGSGAWSYALLAAEVTAMGQGSEKISATATDLAGNVGAPTDRGFELDTVAPDAPVINAVAIDNIINAAEQSFVISGLAEPGTTISLVLGGNIRSLSADSLGAWQYTLTPADLTAMAEGVETLSARATDAAGNQGLAGTRTITVDTLAPNLAITSAVDKVGIGQSTVVTFTFTEDPGASFAWDGLQGSVAVSGGKLGAISGTGLTRSATFTPTAGITGSASITVDAASYSDAAGNAGTAGTTPAIAIDTVAPTVTVSSASAALAVGQTSSITLSFSEDPGNTLVWDAVAQTGDLLVAGGTLSALSGGPGLTRTAVFTPTAGLAAGLGSVAVKSASYQDGFANDGVGGATSSIAIDTLAPTLAITSGVAALKSGESAALRFRFSEAPSGFAASDIQVTQGSISGFAATADPLVYTASFTPTIGFNGTASISVAAAVSSVPAYADAAGNSGGAGAALSIVVDTVDPTVTLSSSVPALKSGATATVSFVFSEDPGSSLAWDASQQSGAITVLGGTLGALSGTGTTRTATFTPTPGFSGNASIAVQAAGYTDAAGNAGSASSAQLIAVDTTAPTLVVTSSSAALKAGETATITFTFSEDPVASFAWDGTAGDIAVTGGSLNAIVPTSDPKVFTATFTPATAFKGFASITVAGANYQDLAGNDGVSALTPLIAIDTAAPTVTVASSRSALKSGQTAVITFTFSEDPGSSFVWDGTAGDVTVTGGALSALSGTGLSRSATFTPTEGQAAGTGSITVTSASYTDAAGNTGAAGSSPSISIDTLAPTLTIGSDTATLKAGQTAAITFTYSEVPAVSLVTDASSILVTGGTLGTVSATADAKVFTATFTPTAGLASGLASISAAAASYTDVAGNAGAAAPTPVIAIDTIAPTLAITSHVSTLKLGETATITFSFSEDPGSSFSDADFVLVGGTLGTLGGFGLSRTAVFTPATGFNGNASITVASASYADAAGNDGSAGLSPLISIDTGAPTVTGLAMAGATGALNKTLNASDTVSISVAMSEVTFVNGTPTLELDMGGTAVLATYQSGSGTQSLLFSYTVVSENDGNGISIAANKLALAGGTLLDAAGNAAVLSHAALSANADYLVDTLAPAAPVIAAVTSDNIINAAEQTSSLSGTAEAGAVVTLSLGGNSRKVTADSNGAWRYALVAADIAAMGEGAETLSATSTDAAGNVSSLGSRSIVIDTVAPTVSVSSISGGTLNKAEYDALTAATPVPLTISGTTAGVENGRSVTLTFNSKTYTAAVSGDAWSLALPTADATALNHGASYTALAAVSDLAGNPAVQASASLAVDIAAPDTPTVDRLVTNNGNPVLSGKAQKTTGANNFQNLAGGDQISVTVNSVVYSLTVGVTSSPAGLSLRHQHRPVATEHRRSDRAGHRLLQRGSHGDGGRRGQV